MKRKQRYNQYIHSSHWKTLRRERTLKCGGCCESCGSKSNIEGHHINYRNLTDCTVDDIVMLCEVCHVIFHQACDQLRINPKGLPIEGIRDAIERGKNLRVIQINVDNYHASQRRVERRNALRNKRERLGKIGKPRAKKIRTPLLNIAACINRNADVEQLRRAIGSLNSFIEFLQQEIVALEEAKTVIVPLEPKWDHWSKSL
jgi:hypothetical protein